MKAGSLELHELSCGAGQRVLFEALSLHLAAGQWASLRGHNGSGKSTLLRCVAGLGRPLSGVTHLHGNVLYQSHYAGWKDLLSPLENLAWQMALDQGASKAKLGEAQLLRAIETVGIADQAKLPFVHLSAGQKRRLSMARLLLSQAPIWLLDEPTTALDAQGQALCAQLLDAHLQNNGLALVATHLDLPGLTPHLSVSLGGA